MQQARRCRRLQRDENSLKDAISRAAASANEAEGARNLVAGLQERLGRERAEAQAQMRQAAETLAHRNEALSAAENRCRALEADNAALRESCTERQQQLDAAMAEIHEQSAAAFLRRAQEGTISELRARCNQLQSCMETQEYQLATWETYQKQRSQKDVELRRAASAQWESTEVQANTRDELSRQLRDSAMTCMAQKNRIEELEKERERHKQDAQNLLGLLETQRSTSASQLEAISTKYATIKRVCTHLQAQSIALHAQLEEHSNPPQIGISSPMLVAQHISSISSSISNVGASATLQD